MAEDFKVIETQEDFDKAIKERLARKEKEVSETFKEYVSPDKVASLKEEYEKKLAEANKKLDEVADKLKSHDSIVSELTERATKAETSLMKSRIAHESGVPIELAERLVGSTEDELKKDAETLAAFMKPTSAPPARTTETPKANTSDAAMMQLLQSINGAQN